MATVFAAVKLVCNLRTIAGGLLVVSSGMALRRCSSLDEFVEVFNKVVLVSYSKLVEISEGSLCFAVQAETSSALKELWDMYKGGTLQNRLQEFLVTDEIKQLASGEDVQVTVYIDEQDYKAAYLDLMLLQKQGKVLKHINFMPSLSAVISLVCGSFIEMYINMWGCIQWKNGRGAGLGELEEIALPTYILNFG